MLDTADKSLDFSSYQETYGRSLEYTLAPESIPESIPFQDTLAILASVNLFQEE